MVRGWIETQLAAEFWENKEIKPIKIDASRFLPEYDAGGNPKDGHVLIPSRFEWGDYEAISYCWESNDRNKDILVNGKIIRITSNLEALLKELQHLPEARSNLGFWVDGLCINQEDTLEKNHQKQLSKALDRTLIHGNPKRDKGGSLLELPSIGTFMNDWKDLNDEDTATLSEHFKIFDRFRQSNTNFTVFGVTLRAFFTGDNAFDPLRDNLEVCSAQSKNLKRAAKALQCRRLCTTETGYLCLAPDDVQIGDVVAVILGCNYPVLLRPFEGGFKYVGECYVDGMMDGEAIDAAARGYRPAQSFILHQFGSETERPQLIKEDEERYRYAYQPPQTANSTTTSRNNSYGTLVVQQEQTVAEPHVPKQVSPIAVDRIQHLGTFIRLYLPRADGPALPPPSALMLALPTMPANSQVLLAAIDALSAAQLAVNDRDRSLVERSRSMYGTALSHMMKAIQDPVLALKDETLLSTYMLTLYEVFVGVTQGHGFFYHVQGLLHLIRQRGPESFKTRLSLQIFHAIRYNSLSIGYHMRKASLLDSPEWLSVTARAAKTDPYVALNDLCICIPRLLERTDRLGTPDSPLSDVDAVISDSEKLANRAFEWLSDFEKFGPRYDKVPISTMEAFLENINPDLIFDPVFNFHYFGAGICYMIYWMSMLILQGNTFRLLRTHRSLEPKQLMTWMRQLSSFADNICCSIPFHSRPQTGYTAKFGSLTPLVVARKFYENAPGMQAKADWCAKVYVVARVPGLYQETPVALEPFKEVQSTVKGNKRFI
ncbi:hypothetical protein E8E13_004671 [Curvularia kusanoi]|uniref:Heterokaryon incompatibility domain-containing protein n=1 Tax=Curvularia kusanoi TaxID=90978 RepID=A0A9P4W6I2_CURKU|nr:hypothetical protein E8E13_004671 [Curvularia kusanoi]